MMVLGVLHNIKASMLLLSKEIMCIDFHISNIDLTHAAVYSFLCVELLSPQVNGGVNIIKINKTLTDSYHPWILLTAYNEFGLYQTQYEWFYLSIFNYRRVKQFNLPKCTSIK